MTARWGAALAGSSAVAVLAAVMIGSRFIGLDDLAAIARGTSVGGVRFIVMENRLPAALVGLLAGFGLGVSGALFQSLLRNPLASPDVIGISLGASTMTVLGMLLWGIQGLPLVALAWAGALAVALALYAWSHRARDTGGALILSGVAVAALLQAVITYLMSRADLRLVADTYRWIAGSLNSATWRDVWLLSVVVALVGPVAVLTKRPLTLLSLGDDAASALGLRVEPTRLALVTIGAGLAAAAVAVTGPLAFVSFLAGPISRLLLRGRTSLLVAGLCGGLLVVLAETIAHGAFGSTNLPVGIITGALGAPALIVLLVRSRRV